MDDLILVGKLHQPQHRPQQRFSAEKDHAADFTLPDPPGPPPARSFLTEMVLGGNQVPATANPWPFLVS